MSEQGKNPNPFDQLLEAIRLVVREEIASLKTELNGGHIAEKDWLEPTKLPGCMDCQKLGLRSAAEPVISPGLNRGDTRYFSAGM